MEAFPHKIAPQPLKTLKTYIYNIWGEKRL